MALAVGDLGIVTPVLTMLPRAHAAWEESAGIAEVDHVVRAADRLGFGFATCSEHVAVPVEVAEVRGGRYWDPLATFGYLAARTEQIRFATYVLVLGYHHPLAIAKRYGTLDQVSGGRLVLGVGVGSLEQEFELLEAPFADRGARADDALRALRASLSTTTPSYEGSHHAFQEVIVDPAARQEHVPIWVGGRTRRSLRRAVDLADGWAPFGLAPDEVHDLLREVSGDRPLEVVLQPVTPIDPLDAPTEAAAALDDLAAAGATRVALRFVHRSPGHYLEQLEATAALVAP